MNKRLDVVPGHVTYAPDYKSREPRSPAETFRNPPTFGAPGVAELREALAAVLSALDKCDSCGDPALWHSKSHTYRRCDAKECDSVPSGVVRVEYPYANALRKVLPCLSPTEPRRQPR